MKICVYGASSNAIDPAYLAAGEELGRRLAQRGHGLVFGGGADGMMGALARGAHECGGEIIGVAPSFFNVDGILYEHSTEFIYTDTMRQRKQIMEEMADAFVMTAGGIGTFEEFFEILTLRQLGQHKKPIAVLNTKGYYDSMEAMLRGAVEGRFMKKACLDLFGFFEDTDALLSYLEQPTVGTDFMQMKYAREEEE